MSVPLRDATLLNRIILLRYQADDLGALLPAASGSRLVILGVCAGLARCRLRLIRSRVGHEYRAQFIQPVRIGLACKTQKLAVAMHKRGMG